LAELENITFGHYYGNVIGAPSWMQWYASRPGLDPSLCQAAFAGEELVASVLVTSWPMRLTGEIVLCGLVDQVMTHPEHRRRGLARRLLLRALESMRAVGAEVSLLYTLETEPMSGPQRLYESLGYAVIEQVDRYSREYEKRPPTNTLTTLPNDNRTREMFTEALGARDGWLKMEEELWQWRRVARPSEYPVALVKGAQGQLAAIVTGNFMVDSTARPFSVITEMSLPEDGEAGQALAEVVSATSREAALSMLCARADIRIAEGLRMNGCAIEGTEIAMVKALTERGARLAASRKGPWYVAVESVIGI
jgi:GNAT superfamily N-acetyltransferase